MKVLFLQSAHLEHDDRVYYHQRKALAERGDEVLVLSTFGKGLSKKEEFGTIRNFLQKEKPDYVICDTPKTVLCSMWAGAKIVYDVTEWYPSKKNLRGRGKMKGIVAFLMIFLNFLAGLCTDRFIFGEESKRKPFRIFFWKKNVLLPYYPSKQLFAQPSFRTIENRCRILYAGPLTKEKGWERVRETIAYCREKRPDYRFELDVISPEKYMTLPDFCRYISHADLCLDLRDIDIENTRCLPIKIFYYMAVGKPVIYSRQNAIVEGIPEIESIGKLVQTSQQAAEAILYYIDHPDIYMQSSRQARDLYERKYNWEYIEKRLLQIVE